jgi:UDP-3-O-[3-hydroxymyristoyl] N-acetylglucosamine deacetylase
MHHSTRVAADPQFQASGLGPNQATVKTSISCQGHGVHSGQEARLTIRPAEADSGIIFHRTDLGRSIPALFSNVVDTRLCTVLADPADPAARVGTVEHLMAALAAAGVDNAVIDIDGPEVPILDGSAAPFSFLLASAGIRMLDTPRRILQVRRPVRVTDGEAWAELLPMPTVSAANGPVLRMDVSIDFASAAIGAQSCQITLGTETFRRDVARARTFAMAHEVEALRAAGLARGGSLDNAIVVDGDRVMNPGGLRMENEFATHKLLDAVGDLFLAGGFLHGRFVGHRSGHGVNNRLLRALFAEAGAFRVFGTDARAVAAA